MVVIRRKLSKSFHRLRKPETVNIAKKEVDCLRRLI